MASLPIYGPVLHRVFAVSSLFKSSISSCLTAQAARTALRATCDANEETREGNTLNPLSVIILNGLKV